VDAPFGHRPAIIHGKLWRSVAVRSLIPAPTTAAHAAVAHPRSRRRTAAGGRRLVLAGSGRGEEIGHSQNKTEVTPCKAKLDRSGLRQKSDATEIPGVVAMPRRAVKVIYQGAFGNATCPRMIQ